jgi:folate-binding protein YgfZ
MTLDYQALHEGAAYLDLSHRGKIFVTGEDRARFLHAMTTNHVQQLRPAEGCYAFFLSVQGRILGDANLFCLEGRFLLDVEPETRERLRQHLNKFIIGDDVTLADATDAMSALGVEGPKAEEVMAAIGAPLPQAPYSHLAWDERIVAHVSFTGAPGYRIFSPKERAPELIRRLEAAGAVAADPESARVVRIEHLRPRYGEDVFDSTLAMETQQNHALHFSKGCYLGQEIVERVRSRGHLNRVLVGLEIDSMQPPAPGTVLTLEGNEVGKITSAAFSWVVRKVVGMAYVRAQHAAPKTVLMADGSAAITTPLAAPLQVPEAAEPTGAGSAGRRCG